MCVNAVVVYWLAGRVVGRVVIPGGGNGSALGAAGAAWGLGFWVQGFWQVCLCLGLANVDTGRGIVFWGLGASNFH